MKGTLKMAQHFEDSLDFLWDGEKLEDHYRMSYKKIHSCAAVETYRPYEVDTSLWDCIDYIKAIDENVPGMLWAFGADSSAEVMCYYDYTKESYQSRLTKNRRMKIQMQRALWLTLLAELAEQGEEF